MIPNVGPMEVMGLLTGLRDLLHYTWATAIVGDIMKIRANDIGLGDIAIVEMPNGEQSLAQVIQLEGDDVSLQVFGGGKGLSTQTTVRFLGHPAQVIYSPNILGRVFRGAGTPIDGGPDLSGDRQVDIGGPSVNPVTRVVPTKMIHTNVPMIDVFNCLVDRQLCEVPVGLNGSSLACSTARAASAARRVRGQASCDTMVACGRPIRTVPS
jgi:V/A-type H+/Na+-transporting ATPase subunit B